MCQIRFVKFEVVTKENIKIVLYVYIYVCIYRHIYTYIVVFLLSNKIGVDISYIIIILLSQLVLVLFTPSSGGRSHFYYYIHYTGCTAKQAVLKSDLCKH